MRFPGTVRQFASAARNYAAYAPGILIAGVVAVAAAILEKPLQQAILSATGAAVTVPTLVIALFIGMLLHPVASNAAVRPGLTFCIKRLLRIAVASLGAKIAFGDIAALGLSAIAITIVAMVATVAAGLWLARLVGETDSFGALAGCATAVCGASAALATASVLPESRRKEADTIIVVIAVNTLSTVAMVIYPLMCAQLGFDERTTGIMLGASIHDVAQVVGAGYAVSDAAGNTAVIVKLFRVLMLLPVVMSIGWWFNRTSTAKAKVPVPGFAIAFFVLVLLNSTGLIHPVIKQVLAEVSKWGLLLAIAALGLSTSFALLRDIGIRQLVVTIGTTIVILVIVTGLLLIG